MPMGSGDTTLKGVIASLFSRLSAGSQAGRPRGLLRVWPIWERVARRIWLTTPIPGAPHNLFALHLTHYHGVPLPLPDGTVIQDGDPVGELHMNGAIVSQMVGRHSMHMLPATRDDLRALAAYTVQSDVKAFYGVTLLAAGTVRFGFTRRPLPINARRRLERFFQTGLLALYSPEGLARLTRGQARDAYPEEIWISRDELIRRYG